MTDIQLPEIGQPFEGGFYTGKMMIDGRLAVIVSASKQHELRGVWGEYGQDVKGAKSTFDCVANTQAMAEAGSEIAKQVQALTINGFSDWAIPSRDAVELQYRHLKPTTQENYCSWRDGDNPSSVPPGHIYTEESPAQTTADAFKEGGDEAFEAAWYWTSTQYSAYDAYVQDFGGGGQNHTGKTSERRVRPVRRLFI